jgi:hypothetical protein
VGNPAEETYCYPNNEILCSLRFLSTPRQLMLITRSIDFFDDYLKKKERENLTRERGRV